VRAPEAPVALHAGARARRGYGLAVVALRPVVAQVVRPEHAPRVVGPAYDALAPEERLAVAGNDADSFFNVVRSPADDGRAPAEVLAGAASTLARLLATGRYGPPTTGLFLYRLASAYHTQVAVVGDVPTTAVTDGAVRPHELTRTAKEDELARHLDQVRVNSSPVGLTYRPSPRVDEVVAAGVGGEPLVELTSGDGVTQTVWATSDDAAAALVEAFAAVDRAYIVDGHHRVAATVRVGVDAFLAGLVPTDQLQLLPYHRVVAGPLPSAATALVERLGAVPAAPEGPPGAPGTMLVRVAGRWWRAPLDDRDGARLDVVALEEDVLAPVLGIGDPRLDPRLDVVPGHLDLARLAALVDRQHGVGFALHPPTVEQLMAEADAGRTLPPKSTWFEPKLHSGVFVVRR
jgi:uncharacterized protein (DUF1015 family)